MIEFAVLDCSFEEAINIAKENISLRSDKYWIEFSSVDDEGETILTCNVD